MSLILRLIKKLRWLTSLREELASLSWIKFYNQSRSCVGSLHSGKRGLSNKFVLRWLSLSKSPHLVQQSFRRVVPEPVEGWFLSPSLITLWIKCCIFSIMRVWKSELRNLIFPDTFRFRGQNHIQFVHFYWQLLRKALLMFGIRFQVKTVWIQARQFLWWVQRLI